MAVPPAELAMPSAEDTISAASHPDFEQIAGHAFSGGSLGEATTRTVVPRATREQDLAIKAKP